MFILLDIHIRSFLLDNLLFSVLMPRINLTQLTLRGQLRRQSSMMEQREHELQDGQEKMMMEEVNPNCQRQQDYQDVQGDKQNQSPKSNDSSKKLTKLYKSLIQKSQIRYYKTRGLCVIIKPKVIRPYLVQVIPTQEFHMFYVKNFKKSFPQKSKAQVIEIIMRLLISAKNFVGKNHFNVNKGGSCTLEIHASQIYKPYKKTTSKDHRVRIPGTTGLLKVIFRHIFAEHLKTDQRIRNFLNDKHNSFHQKHLIFQKLKKKIYKQLAKTANNQKQPNRKKKKTIKYLKKMDSKVRVDQFLIKYAIQALQKNTYNIKDYQMQQNIQERNPNQYQSKKEQNYIDELINQKNNFRKSPKKRQQEKIKQVVLLITQNQNQSALDFRTESEFQDLLNQNIHIQNTNNDLPDTHLIRSESAYLFDVLIKY